MIAIAAERNGNGLKPDAHLLTEEVSPSRLKRWLTCGLQFYFHYVKRIQKPATPALVVGKVVHAVLQQNNRSRWRGDTDHPFAGRLNAVFDSVWQEEQEGQEINWDGDEIKHKLAALGLLELYLAQTPIPPDEKPMAVEVKLEADLGKYGLPKLIGILDLVRPTGVIVDFKTSSQTPNADSIGHQNEIQLTSYGILFRENTGSTELAIELYHLVKTKTPKLIVTSLPPITDNQKSRLFRQIESYVRGVEAEDYVAAPSMACLSCQFLGECKSWH